MALSLCDCTADASGRELLEHGSPLFPCGCYLDDLPMTDFPWHWHEELEFAIVVQGDFQLSAGGSSFRLSAGQGFFINSSVLHHGTGQGRCLLHSVVFHPRLVGGSMDSVFWHRYLLPLMQDTSLPCLVLSPRTDWMASMLEDIEAAWQACAQEPPQFEFTVRAALSRCVGLLCSSRPAPACLPSAKALRDSRRLKAMLSLIHSHYAQNLTISQIAAAAHISESECLRCFRSGIGLSPVAYLKKYRLQTAAELLRSSSRSVQDIASCCGFHEMGYFARSFRTLFGCTPSQYRR